MQLLDFSEKADVPNDNIKVYRYFDSGSFDRFISNGLSMTRIESWPDRFETAGFEFMQEFPQYNDARSRLNFFASCWSFDTVSRHEFDNDSSYNAAEKELRNDGSAAMWENYCREGGVRICTTIGKLKSAFQASNLSCQIVHCGAVKYCAAMDNERLNPSNPIEKTFFFKRIGFRHELEYRFITYLENENSDWVSLPVKDYFDFLEEILVFPLKNNSLEVCANNLHEKSIAISTHPTRGSNSKNGSTFCRISQLYGMVSNEIGNVRYLGQT